MEHVLYVSKLLLSQENPMLNTGVETQSRDHIPELCTTRVSISIHSMLQQRAQTSTLSACGLKLLTQVMVVKKRL